MKLWYQSVSRQKSWGAYNKVLRRIIDGIKDPGTEIEVHGITKLGGVGDQFRYLEYLETGEVMENVLTPQGVEAVEAAIDECEHWTSVDPLLDPLRRYGSS